MHVLIGRIKDEFHKTQDDWVANPDGSLTVKGKCSIYALEQALDRDIEVPTDDQIETVAGLIMHRLGGMPSHDARLEFPEFDVWIQKIDGPHIQQMTIYPKKLGESNTSV